MPPRIRRWSQRGTQLSQFIAATATAPVTDTLVTGEPITGATRTARDSLAAQVAQLGRLLARAENAPLLGSYRALAEAPAMRGDASVNQLLDSLVEIERERESYNAVGGVDPVFVALTARANELGRAIEAVAIARRAGAARDRWPRSPRRRPTSPSRPVPDTLQRIADPERRSRRCCGSREPTGPRAEPSSRPWTRAKDERASSRTSARRHRRCWPPR